MKTALITGIAGQDGSYLAELLKQKGYEVEGVEYGDGDLCDIVFVNSLVSKEFDEIYNLASVSTVMHPWEDPLCTIKSTGMIPLTFLEAIRVRAPRTRFFQASSSEMYGDPVESPQNERTQFHPQKPYGYGKLLAHQAVVGYRKNHNLFAVSGILFNHESPRRGENFVTRKITSTLAHIAHGLNEVLFLGNLDVKRDWGFAGDYVSAMHLMLQADVADDYVVATGNAHTVREFVEVAAQALDIPLVWSGIGSKEIGKAKDGRTIVAVSKEFYRPSEMLSFIGDSTKIQKELGWSPTISFEGLVEMMAIEDFKKSGGSQ
jgi:GDP-D-mannose dehydratase